MAIYFVDGDNGSDTNNGTSPETAWKTIGKATTTMIAGDSVIIKPTTYREYINLDNGNSGSNGNYISYIGDYKGEYFGVKGYPRITGIDNDYDVNPARYSGISLTDTTKAYFNIKNLQIDNFNYRTIVIENYTTSWDAYINVENCILLDSPKLLSSAATENFLIARARNITIKNCFITVRKIGIYINGNTSLNANINIINNFIIGGYYYYTTSYFNSGIYLHYYNANIYHNFIHGCFYNIYADYLSTSYPAIAKYNILTASYYGISTSNSGTITSDYNFYIANNTARYNVTAGANDKDNVPLMFNWKYLSFLKQAYAIDYINDSNDTITEDILGNPRPLNSYKDVGPFEYNPEPVKEASIIRSGSASLKIVKAGYVDKVVWLSSGSHTISVYTKWSGYSGSSKPQLIVKQDNYCGISSNQVATAIGDGSNWEQLSVNITLTKDALVEYRLYARDTGSTAVTYFDDDNVT